MSEIAIRCDHLRKQYRIGERESYKTLRDVITDGVLSPLRRLRSALRNGNAASPSTLPFALSPSQDAQPPTPDARNPNNTFWALDDVSFEVNRGEVVGIIGRNGAGKSTLLKILSRITKPTRGHAEVHGRVGSLLEVGTGFHPELTGRENIYLNAAILGMRKAEVAKKFDEIVAFAEVEKFIDTPVKRYSSGMYVRLAFAVAAHMETEVLVVDEVLAVGDAAFQKKCLGKLDDVSKHGRTVIMVSHQMNQIRQLCNSVLWIDNGKLREAGSTNAVVSSYQQSTGKLAKSVRESSSASSFLAWDIDGRSNVLEDGLSPFKLNISMSLREKIQNGHLGVHIVTSDNSIVTSWGFDGLALNPGVVTFVLDLPSLPLQPGVYGLACSLFNGGNNVTGGKLVDKWYGNPAFIVEAAELAHPQDQWAGILNLPGRLTTQNS